MIRQTTVLAAFLALAACEPAPLSPAAAPAAAAHGTDTARGAFTGASNHVTTGHATIFTEGGKWFVRLDSDFAFDGAPDPHVALGHDGYRADASLGLLKSNQGEGVYEIPHALDVADFNEVWIWCDQFSVPLGVAKLALL